MTVSHSSTLVLAHRDALEAPAAASLDMYTGMSQRGDLFAEFANALPNAQPTTQPTAEGGE